jgi:hypothetical protein
LPKRQPQQNKNHGKPSLPDPAMTFGDIAAKHVAAN